MEKIAFSLIDEDFTSNTIKDYRNNYKRQLNCSPYARLIKLPISKKKTHIWSYLCLGQL